MQELDVVITDFILAAECLLFSYLLLRYYNGNKETCFWFALSFIAVALTSILAGIVHAYEPYPEGSLLDSAWIVTLIFLGISSVCAWNIGSLILFNSKKVKRVFLTASIISFFVYSFYVTFISQTFLTAILFYVPANIFLLFCFVVQFHRIWHKHIAYGVFAVLLLFVSSGIQQMGVGIGDGALSHNALFHVIQFISMYLLYKAASLLSGLKDIALQK